MTEPTDYQTISTRPQDETSGLSVRRLVLLRRYDRLLSHMALLGKVIVNVQSNLSSPAHPRALRRSS
jgi:hypothetical protein